MKGQTLVMLLIFMVVIIMVTTASVAMVVVNSQATDKVYQGITALDVAESGGETAMIKLLRDPEYAGETISVGKGEAVISVTGTNPKVVLVKGTLDNFTRTIQIIADYSDEVLTVTSWKEISS